MIRCPACGREMVSKDSYLECSNRLCDYEEEIVQRDVLAKQKREPACIIFSQPAICFN